MLKFRDFPRAKYTHRIAYEITNGPLGKNFACHHCDNPPCCNPSHLFAGTGKDNAADKMKKGRYGSLERRHGIEHKFSKLTDEYVREIRTQRAAGVTSVELAARFGVTPGTIYSAVVGRTWRRVK